jgi:beta-hydroxylase
MIFIIICLIVLLILCCIYQYCNNDQKYIFYSSNDYPQFKIIEENWEIIRDEIPDFDINNIKIKRNKDVWDNEKMESFAKILADDPQWFKSWDNTNVWYSFPLMYHGQIVGKVKEICPITCKLLESLNNVRIAGFSLLTPLGELEKHQDDTGPNFKSMALNMNLTGDKCSLLIKPDAKNKYYEHYHQKGKAVIFNAEPWHYAKNYDNKNRVILYIDFWTK